MNTMLMKRLGHGRETAYGDLVISREQGLGVWNLNLFFSPWYRLVRSCMEGVFKPRETYTWKYSRYVLILVSCFCFVFSLLLVLSV